MMTRQSTPFTRLSTAYVKLSNDSRYFLEGAAHPGLPNYRIPIAEVKEHLLDRSTPPNVRDDIWRSIIERARENRDNDWTVLCFGLARPGLVRAVNRAARICPGITRSELEDEALKAFIDAIIEINLAAAHVCSRLCQVAFSQARTAARNYLRDLKTASQMVSESQVPPPPSGHVDLVLADAVRDHIINRLEAHIIGATRIDTIDLGHLSKDLGISRVNTDLLRKEAESRLVEWLQERPGVPQI